MWGRVRKSRTKFLRSNILSKSPNTPPLEGRGRVVRRTVNDHTQNFGRERSERHSDADYAFLYNKVMASLVPLVLSEGNLIASQSDAWSGGMEAKNVRRPPIFPANKRLAILFASLIASQIGHCCNFPKNPRRLSVGERNQFLRLWSGAGI